MTQQQQKHIDFEPRTIVTNDVVSGQSLTYAIVFRSLTDRNAFIERYLNHDKH